MLEKHIAIDTDKYPKNDYSATPEDVELWLENAQKAFQMLGVNHERHPISNKEEADLRQFRRGVFVKKDFTKGTVISTEDLFYAWPCEEGQLVANDLSKYF